VLFGSVLQKDVFKDVDLLAVLPQTKLDELSKQVEELNKINVKRIHVVKQSLKDLRENLVKQDKIAVAALRSGVVVFGHEALFEVMVSVAR